jgi:hypothetical protein
VGGRRLLLRADQGEGYRVVRPRDGRERERRRLPGPGHR